MKKLWGIRHIRFAWHSYRAQRQADAFASIGIGLGHIHPSDIEILEDIRAGRR